ncbi:MAG: type IV pilin N-terminal domain-containing protein [Methanoregulaceae archaeon]
MANKKSSWIHGDFAVSDTMGVILLVSVAIIGVTATTVTVISQPHTEQIPAIQAQVSTDDGHIYITNMGGDAVTESELRIYVDGQVTDFTFPANGVWSIGQTISSPITSGTSPKEVSIAYMSVSSSGNGGDGGTIIASSSLTGSSTLISSGQGSYTISASSNNGGNISPSGSVSVGFRGSQTFTIANSTGYSVSDVRVDGSSVGPVSSYTFSNVMASHNITATFANLKYQVSTTVVNGTGGSISPVSATVDYGGSQTFNITNNTGYYINKVLIDGFPVGAVSSYTFSNVTAPHTVTVTFARFAYTLTATAGTGGSISPASATVAYGDDQTFVISNNTGYSISNLTLDGNPVSWNSVAACSTYTLTNITASHIINATFSGLTYPITATAGSGGSISPLSAQVTYGGSQRFSITPSSGYFVNSVIVDGTTLAYPVSSYTFSNVTSSHTISATFITQQKFYDMLLNTAYKRGGYFVADTYIQFVVTGPYSYIYVNGNTVSLPSGSVVRVTLNSNQTGGLYVSGGQITTIAFSSATVSVNGTTVATGSLPAAYVSSYSSYISTLTLVVPVASYPTWTDFEWNGVSIVPDVCDNSLITLYGLGPNSAGLLNANTVSGSTVYYVGGATSYSLAITQPVVTGISPASGSSGSTWVTYTCYGSQFAGDNSGIVSVVLQKSGSANVTATQAYVQDSGTRITGAFNLAGVSKGTWNVIVTNYNGGTTAYPNAFTVY